mgnify:CR=1 FL=1
MGEVIVITSGKDDCRDYGIEKVKKTGQHKEESNPE